MPLEVVQLLLLSEAEGSRLNLFELIKQLAVDAFLVVFLFELVIGHLSNRRSYTNQLVPLRVGVARVAASLTLLESQHLLRDQSVEVRNAGD